MSETKVYEVRQTYLAEVEVITQIRARNEYDAKGLLAEMVFLDRNASDGTGIICQRDQIGAYHSGPEAETITESLLK